MYTLRVSPIAKGGVLSELTYFSKDSYEPGSLVWVPVRTKEKAAVVLSCEDVRSAKSRIRKGDFSLKKLQTEESFSLLTDAYIQAAQETARYHLSPIGALLYAGIPQSLLTRDILSALPDAQKARGTKQPRISALQNNYEERVRQYKRDIRESLARKESVFVIASTVQEVADLASYLSEGIEDHVHALHSGLSTKKQQSAWNAILAAPKATVIVATPSHISIPRRDVGLIVVERESASAYKTLTRPYIDWRFLIEKMALHQGAHLIYADTLLRTSTAERLMTRELREHPLHTWHYALPSRPKVVDMKAYQRSYTSAGVYGPAVFSPQALRIVEGSATAKTLILGIRKGSYPLTQCDDCGSIVRCPTCTYPLVLYEKESENEYVCNICNERYGSDIRCSECESWKLTMLGIGTERIAKEVQSLAPKTPLYTIHDKERPAALHKKIESWYENGGVFIITQPYVHHFKKKYDNALVVTMDSLFALPDPLITETILRTTLTLATSTLRSFIIQTRTTTHPLIPFLTSTNTRDFFTFDSAEKKKIGITPHTVPIKLTWTNDNPHKVARHLKHLFKDTPSHLYPSLRPAKSGKKQYNLLLTWPDASTWPPDDVYERSLRLPRYVHIDINPSSFL